MKETTFEQHASTEISIQEATQIYKQTTLYVEINDSMVSSFGSDDPERG